MLLLVIEGQEAAEHDHGINHTPLPGGEYIDAAGGESRQTPVGMSLVPSIALWHGPVEAAWG